MNRFEFRQRAAEMLADDEIFAGNLLRQSGEEEGLRRLRDLEARVLARADELYTEGNDDALVEELGRELLLLKQETLGTPG